MSFLADLVLCNVRDDDSDESWGQATAANADAAEAGREAPEARPTGTSVSIASTAMRRTLSETRESRLAIVAGDTPYITEGEKRAILATAAPVECNAGIYVSSLPAFPRGGTAGGAGTMGTLTRPEANAGCTGGGLGLSVKAGMLVPSAISAYRRRLAALPEPGKGKGCHPALLGAANVGLIAGRSGQQVFSDLRRAIRPGSRRVTDREIWDAVTRAERDRALPMSPRCGARPADRHMPEAASLRDALSRLISDGDGVTESDIAAASPVAPAGQPKDQLQQLLDTLYEDLDFVFIGPRDAPGRLHETIRYASSWKHLLDQGWSAGEHIILNPLSGEPAQREDGGTTMRGDACVSKFRYCLAEFDSLDIGAQLSFWAVVDLPVVALIHSGGRSIHAWLSVTKLSPVPVNSREIWTEQIRTRLYGGLLVPLGVDPACKNEARLSRTPGHFRAEKQQWQHVVYLNPAGGKVFP